MKSINHIYKSQVETLKFIKLNNFSQSKSLLIQIYTDEINTSNIQKIIELLKNNLPHAIIIGSSSKGTIINEQIKDNQICINFMTFDKSHISKFGKNIDHNSNIKQLCLDIKNNIIKNDTKLVILLGSGQDLILEEIYNKLFILQPEIVYTGGIGAQLTNKKSFVIDAGNIYENGIVCIGIGGNDLQIKNFYNSKWLAIGKPLKITKSLNNQIIQINNKPAISILEEHLGINIEENIEGISSNLPIIFKRHGFEIARKLIGIGNDKSLIISGKIYENEQFQFGFGNIGQMLGHMENIGNIIKDTPIECLLIFSCQGRRAFMLDNALKELDYLNNFGECIGMHGQGQFFCSNGQSHLLNYSISGISIAENNSIKSTTINNLKKENLNSINDGIANLIKYTSDELIKSNEDHLYELEEKIKEIEKSRNNFFESYTKIIEEVPAAIWMGDQEEKTIYANKKFLEMIEYDLDEIKGWLSYNFRDENSRMIVQDNNELRVKGEKSSYNGVLKSKSGKLIPVSCTGIPVHFGTVGMMIDLRELQRIEEEKANLKKLNEMKNDFINIVSHDLRTPMTSIKGYVSMLIDGDFGQINPEALSALQIIFKSAERLVNFINDMLDISKLESGKMTFKNELVNLSDFFKEIQEEYLGYSKAKNLSLFIENEIENLTINTDRSKLKQVIANLLGNAIKFTPDGGKIIIKTSKKDNKIKFEIIDNGIGIDKNDFNKIFTKFGQVDDPLIRNQNGTGLGLNICKEIIKQMGGELKLKSQLGKGSNFYFSLYYN